MPLIAAHGWPGSILELLKIVGPLTDPTAHGGNASDAFHLVIPSMAGYAFSGKPTAPGCGPDRMAYAWVELMKRLGYTRFVAQGGDWGALIVDLMGVHAPPELLAIHTNMAGTVPPEIDKAAFAGAPQPSGLSAEEASAYDQLKFFYTLDLAYAQEMGTRPQTLYGIADSPVGLAAWILDHDARSLALIARVSPTVRPRASRGTTSSTTSRSIGSRTRRCSSSRLYWENKHSFFDVKHVAIPVAVSAFPDELYPVPRSWAEQAYPNLIYYKKHDKGGHFAAWEQPELFVEEVRTGFRSLR